MIYHYYPKTNFSSMIIIGYPPMKELDNVLLHTLHDSDKTYFHKLYIPIYKILDLKFEILIVTMSNPAHGEMYIPYMIKCVSDLWQVGGFLWVFRFRPPIELIATI